MICCFKTGTKFGDEYVTRLRDGVRRHGGGDLVCFTERPVAGVDCRPLPVDLPKWWCKLGAYALGEPLIALDLDIVIVGSLQPLLEWEGFGSIKNPWLKGYNSSVVKLTGNEGRVWDAFTPDVMAKMRGDQDWLNVALPLQKTFPVKWFPSWKVHRLFTMDAPPPEAIAIICHGSPRPHQIHAPWFQEQWLGHQS